MDKIESIVKTLKEAIQANGAKRTAAYDTAATVVRIEGNTAWVHIPGGVDETPVKLTVAASVGDSVQVRVSGGRAFIIGNATAPPTDDRTAIQARRVATVARLAAETANETAQVAKRTAETAKQIADNTDQYFWHTETGTDTGAHITEIPKEDFEADPTNGGGNLLARSNGIAVRDGLTELAQFMANMIRLGGSGEYNLRVVPTAIRLYNGNNALMSMLDSGLRFYNKYNSTAQEVGQLYCGSSQTDTDASVILSVVRSSARANDGYIKIRSSSSYGSLIESNVSTQGSSHVYNSYDYQESDGWRLTTEDYTVSSGDTAVKEVKLCKRGGNPIEVVDDSLATTFSADWAGNITAAGNITVGGHSSPIGWRLSAVWTATSNSSSGAAMTGDITLTPGVWMLGMVTPTCSVAKAYYFSNISSTLTYPYFTLGTGGSGWVPVEISTDTVVHISSGAATSCTYSNLTRGRILAVRIA